jgi:hypothetical protein
LASADEMNEEKLRENFYIVGLEKPAISEGGTDYWGEFIKELSDDPKLTGFAKKFTDGLFAFNAKNDVLALSYFLAACRKNHIPYKVLYVDSEPQPCDEPPPFKSVTPRTLRQNPSARTG